MDHEHLPSLFSPTSAFDTPEVELPQAEETTSPAEDLTLIRELIENVLFTIDDRRGEVTPLLEEVERLLEELEVEVKRHV